MLRDIFSSFVGPFPSHTTDQYLYVITYLQRILVELKSAKAIKFTSILLKIAL
jgi:hypothetical protein